MEIAQLRDWLIVIFCRNLPYFNSSSKRQIRFSLLILSLTILAMGCSNNSRETGLYAVSEQVVKYQCAAGVKVSVSFYRLSDNSLNFIKLTSADLPEATLPSLLSASGSQYGNDSLRFWDKGPEAHVEVKEMSGQWRLLYTDCVPISSNS